jgi:glycopeptide antibiotics resistance protein
MGILAPYLHSIRTAAILFPVVALAAFIPICIRQYRMYGHVAAWRLGVVYAFIFFVMSSYALVLLPLPDVGPNFCEVYNYAPQLEPFEFVGQFAELIRESGLRGLLTSFTFLEVFFNFLLLLPLGFFLRYLFQVRFLPAVGIAFLVSFSFELTQLTGIYGLYPCPYRVFSVDDLILNTVGSVAGFALVSLFPFLPEVDRESLLRNSDDHVSLLRRFVAYITDMVALGLASSLLWFIPDHVAYALWFVVIPVVTHGYTPGKRLLRIRLASVQGPLHWWQIAVRYGVMFGLPQLISQFVVAPLTEPETDGMISGIRALLGLAVMFGMFAAYVGPLLLRRDNRSIPDLLARTTQRVAEQPG